jgi:hypothetical protein
VHLWDIEHASFVVPHYPRHPRNVCLIRDGAGAGVLISPSCEGRVKVGSLLVRDTSTLGGKIMNTTVKAQQIIRALLEEGRTCILQMFDGFWQDVTNIEGAAEIPSALKTCQVGAIGEPAEKFRVIPNVPRARVLWGTGQGKAV